MNPQYLEWGFTANKYDERSLSCTIVKNSSRHCKEGSRRWLWLNQLFLEVLSFSDLFIYIPIVGADERECRPSVTNMYMCVIKRIRISFVALRRSRTHHNRVVLRISKICFAGIDHDAMRFQGLDSILD